jgi:hypothetical protein
VVQWAAKASGFTGAGARGLDDHHSMAKFVS